MLGTCDARGKALLCFEGFLGAGSLRGEDAPSEGLPGLALGKEYVMARTNGLKSVGPASESLLAQLIDAISSVAYFKLAGVSRH